MATISVSVSYRPIRIGFLVNVDDISSLIEACRINTVLWGGVYNPIIPIGTHEWSVESLVESFNVDLLFPVVKGVKVNAIIEDYPYLKLPHYKSEHIFSKLLSGGKLYANYLDIIHVIDHYWREEFRHTETSNCCLVSWDRKDTCSALFALTFGLFYANKDLRYDYSEASRKGLKAQNIQIGLDASIPTDLHKGLTPIRLTGDRLRRQPPYSDRPDGIYVGDEDNFLDLVTFWNVRASGVRLEFLPRKKADRYKSYIEGFIDALDKIPQRPLHFEDQIGIYYLNGDRESLMGSISFLKPVKKFSFCHGTNIEPQLFHFKGKNVMAICEKENDHYSISIPLPERIFANERRLEQNYQTYVIQLDCHDAYAYPGFTLELPFLADLNSFYGRQISFHPWDVRVEQNCVSIIQDFNHEIINVSPLSISDLLIQIFERAGMKAVSSAAGLLTRQIIRNMGELDSCRVFKIRGVRELLQIPVKDISWGSATKIIWDADFEHFKDLHIELRREKNLSTSAVWKYLIKKRVFVPVPSVYYLLRNKILRKSKAFVCRKCGLKAKIPADRYIDSWRCIYCGQNHYLPTFIGTDLVNELRWWRFKKSGLFAKGIKQEGSIPVILTLMTLNQCAKPMFPESKWCTSLELKYDSKVSEIDFAVLSEGTPNDPNQLTIAIGECKGNIEITDDKIENLCDIKRKMDDSGLECFLVFSKTADRFLPAEIDRFKKLVYDKKIMPILFTRQELEPYEPYWYHIKEKTLPYKYTHNFHSIAANSVHIYLE